MTVTQQPLRGVSIVITRAAVQSAGFAGKLEALGATVIELPAIAISPPANLEPIDRAIRQLPAFDWLIFTSVNGVDSFTNRLEALGSSPAGHSRLPVCAIGPATASRARARGWLVGMVPEDYIAESLVAAFAEFDLQGKRILLPRAAVARDVVPNELAKRGATVEVVEVYRTIAPEDLPDRIRKIFAPGSKPAWITFTSSSTVRNFAAAASPEALEGVNVASIGPVTTETARQLGIKVTVEAQPYTLEGLLAALVNASA